MKGYGAKKLYFQAKVFQKVCVTYLTYEGSGKTYMAGVFGIEACKQYYTVKYVRMPDILLDLQSARSEKTFNAVIKKYTPLVLLIIDEWLLLKLTESEATISKRTGCFDAMESRCTRAM